MDNRWRAATAMAGDDAEHVGPTPPTRHWWWPTVAIWTFVGVMVAVGLVMRVLIPPDRGPPVVNADRQEVRLPPADTLGGMALTEALARRRSHREFSDQPLTLQQISQLCWAAQGISNETQGLRTAPSAGALYLLTVYLIDRDGVHEYQPQAHVLRSARVGDLRAKLQAAALNQPAVGSAPLCLVITMDVSRTAAKYGGNAERYCLLEAGHAAQNVLLQATALGLVGVPIAAFNEQRGAELLSLPPNLRPVYLIPLGHAGANRTGSAS